MKEWKKVKDEPYQVFWRKMIKKTYILPDGSEHTFDILDGGKTVGVFALTKEGKVVITQQYRPGPDKLIYDLPGGAVDFGEEPLDAAQREFLEETGYTGDFRCLGDTMADAYSTRRKYHFLAMNCEKVQEQELDEHEFIDVFEMTMDEFKEYLKTGNLSDIDTAYMALRELEMGVVKD